MQRAGASSSAPSSQGGEANTAHFIRPLPRRISVVGASGSGKTYLASKLAAELAIPHHQLDQLRNRDGKKLEDALYIELISNRVAQDAWIMDGHHRSVRELIWQHSSVVVWLDYPFTFVLRRQLGRYLKKIRKVGTPADDGAEPIEFQTVGWGHRIVRLLRAFRERREYRALLAKAAESGVAVLRLRQPTEPQVVSVMVNRISIGDPDFGEIRSPNYNGRIIELFGVPGSGKSTIGDVLVTEIGARNRWEIVSDWRKRSLPLRAWHIARGLMDVRRLLAATRFAWAMRLGSPGAIGRLIRLIAKHHWISSRPGTLLLHQGYLQDVWSMLAFSDVRQIDPDSVARFLSALYRGTNHTFVYFDLDPDNATRRIVSRTNGTSRLDRMSESEIRQRLGERVWVAELVYSAATAAGLTIIKIDANRSVEDVHAEALRVLNARGFFQVAAES